MQNKDYTKMLLCAAIMLCGMALPYFFSTLPAIIFVAIMYQNEIAETLVKIDQAGKGN